VDGVIVTELLRLAVPQQLAVTVTFVGLVTTPAWTGTPFVLAPAGTKTDVGAGKAVELVVWIDTDVPPAGAIPLIVTLNVANAPVTTLGGEIWTELTDRLLLEAPVTVKYNGLLQALQPAEL
jgi:hypothetical protein